MSGSFIWPVGRAGLGWAVLRSPRITESGVVYQVLNRRVMGMTLCERDRDDEGLEKY